MKKSRIEDIVFSSGLSRRISLVFTIVLLSSLFYVCVDWYWYYNSMATEKERDATVVTSSIREIVRSRTNMIAVQDGLTNLLKVVGARVEVRASSEGKELFRVDNNKYIDSSRTQIILNDTIVDNIKSYAVKYQANNRPGVVIALWRAWTFSLYDYILKPEMYMKFKLYNRSTPMLAAVLIVGSICMLWFNYWRRIYEENMDLAIRFTETQRCLAATVQELNTRKGEIEKIRRDKDSEIDSLNLLIADKSRSSGESLYDLEERLNTLLDENALLWTENEGIEKRIASLQIISTELEQGRKADKTKIAEMTTQLMQKDLLIKSISTADDADRTVISRDSRIFSHLKEQLKKWISSPGATKKSFADHGTKGIVEKYLAKIERGFLNDYFVIAKSDEYSPAEKGCIKVTVAPEGVKDYSGTVLVYLDKDSGPCIALSYKTKEKAPTEKVGFVLAIMLRAVCKEFEEYRIK